MAETAFDVVERGLTAEGGPNEFGLPTFPSRRFVSAGGLTLVHEGLPEFELVDIEGNGTEARARTLALTLLRCTGLISNGPMALRPVPAGPATPTPAAQMPGNHVLSYAVHVGGAEPLRGGRRGARPAAGGPPPGPARPRRPATGRRAARPCR